MALYRQGDVLLVRVDEVPEATKAVAREHGRLVLAHGEATGHAHMIADEHAELVSSEGVEELYLLVHGTTARLTHEEHDQIEIEPGSYLVVRQREYRPAAPPAYVYD